MQQAPPAAWRELSAYERDILRYIHSVGPVSGSHLYDALGGVDGRHSEMVAYKKIHQLEDRGLLDSENVDGRTSHYSLTTQAIVLLSKLDECYE